jgi:hypothetical protein
MLDCNQRKTLQAQLDEAFQDWYAVKDIPGSENQKAARRAEKKVHHLSRALTDQVVKHGCTRETEIPVG